MTSRVIAAACGLGLCASGASAASFQGLGDLPGGAISSWAKGVSADGSVVVGYSSVGPSSVEAFRWDAVNGLVSLGDFAGGSVNSAATGVSADGSVIVGSGTIAGDISLAFRWDAVNGLVSIGELPGGSERSSAKGVSADGSVIVGISSSGNGEEAFRWDAVNGMVGLGDLPSNTFFSGAHGVSADGSTTVGYGYSVTYNQGEAAFWNGSWVGLGIPVMGTGEATAASADGSVIVGFGRWEFYNPSHTEYIQELHGFRWSAEDGIVQVSDGRALAVNADGSVVVGYEPGGAFVWRVGDSGTQFIKDILTNEYGLDLTGWTLGSATGVSGDGQVIVGVGTNPSGNPEAWIANLAPPPPVCAGDVNGDHATNSADFNVLASNFGNAVTPGTSGDLNDDGLVNSADFNILAGDFGCGAE